MDNREAMKILKKAGFEEVNQRGSHKKFSNGSRHITLIYHSSPKEKVGKKTAKEIMALKV